MKGFSYANLSPRISDWPSIQFVGVNCKNDHMSIFKKAVSVFKDATKPIQVSTEYTYGEFIVVDVETTGLDPKNHRVVQIALVRVNNGNVIEIFESLFNPEGPVGKTEIHGITQEQVDKAPLFKDKVDEIEKFISGKTLVAHNARFDLAFLRAEFEKSGLALPWLEPLCTLKASEYYLPNLGRRKLADCCGAIGVEIENAHTATGDAIATAKLCHFYLMPEKNPKPRKSDLDLIANPKKAEPAKKIQDQIQIQQRIERSNAERSKLEASTFEKLSFLVKKVGLKELTGDIQILGAIDYLDKLIEFLDDNTLSSEEISQLDNLRAVYELTDAETNLIHSELIIGLIEVALEDEKISSLERNEFKEFCEILKISDSRLPDFTKVARARRVKKLSANLKPLPENWNLGEPLRVGNNVVFTGCDPELREELERDSIKAGITIASSVSKKTSILVTDGGFSGNKAKEAAELGTRIVHPADYEIMLKYIQPSD